MYTELIKIIEEICDQKVDEEMSLFGDLELDSVQMIELVLRIEETYGFHFDRYDELMDYMDTVKDFVHYFEHYIEKQKETRSTASI